MQLYLAIENVTVSFGERQLFHIDDLHIYAGERIGLVGMNGAGKTTLLRLMSGEIAPDAGSVRRLCRPFYFRQFGSGEEQAAPAALRRFGVQGLAAQTQISGGEDTRMRLAEMFSAERAFALLDEPTANLDAAGIRALEEKLAALETFVLVSHDRDLLNRWCTRIWEIEGGGVQDYAGNYDDYCAQKAQARERMQAEYEQYVSERDRLQQVYAEKKAKARKVAKKPKNISRSDAKVKEFSASHRSVGSKAQMLERSAKNVQQRIAHMAVKERPRELPRIRPDFRLTDPPQNRIVLEAEHLDFTYPNGREIFRDASFQLPRGSRTALLGPNGAGKTTLLRLIKQGEQVRIVPKARLGFFRQDLGDLDAKKSVLQNVLDVSVQREAVARTILARLLFGAREMDKPAGVLSGGERVRLAFARLFVSAANVLILDEPTNYLDLPSLEALQALFAEYEGTMLFVSHDAAFVRAVATRRLAIEAGKIREEDGLQGLRGPAPRR